jgi:hypothetical protein
METFVEVLFALAYLGVALVFVGTAGEFGLLLRERHARGGEAAGWAERRGPAPGRRASDRRA